MIKNDQVRVTTTAFISATILSAIMVIVPRTKPIFKLEREFDGSYPYLKFGRNPIKMTELE